MNFLKNDNLFIAVVVILTLLSAFLLARFEINNRAKNAWLEGEKYYTWHQNPEQKKSHFDLLLAKNLITADEYKYQMEDSDLKNAFVWYETVVELFQPPRSRWVIKAEARLKEIKPQRDAWLRSLGIEPVE
jgi:hypothetical protein